MDRGVKIALLLSLIFNIFAVGVFTGRVLKPNEPPRPQLSHRGDDPMRFMRYAHELSPESKEVFRSAMRENIPAIREKRKELRQLTNAYNEALQAEPWDRTAVDAALLEVQMAQADIRKMIGKSFVNAVEKLEPEDRALLRDSDRRRMHRRDPRGAKRGPERRPPPEQ